MLASVAFEANLKDMYIIKIPHYRPFVIITIEPQGFPLKKILGGHSVPLGVGFGGH